MKKNCLCLLFLSSLLLSACGSSNGNKEGKSAHFYDISPFGEDEEEEEEENPNEVDYSYLFMLDTSKKSQCLVEEQVKLYTDAMYDQRDNDDWKDEDKINNLHGDNIRIKTYMGNYDNSVPAEVRFEVDDSIKNDGFKVRCWPKGEKRHYREVLAMDGAAQFYNLKRGTQYEWCVISSSGKKSGVGTFKTDEYVRFLSCGKLFNVRDCGGWTTLDGKKVKQGLLYRGGEINEKQFDMNHTKNVTEEGKEIFVKDLGIKRQIDLRNDNEAHDMTYCPMNRDGAKESDPDFVYYTRLEIDSYSNGLNTKVYQNNIKTCFEQYLTNIDNEPIYCNCYGGADRTGTLCFLVGAILGMSYTDLIIDYEATSFSNNYKAHNVNQSYSKWPDMIDSIKKWSFYDETKPLKEIIETYLTTVCGVSASSIEKIREIMLEDPKTLE